MKEKILVVEDDRDTGCLVNEILVRQGYRVTLAGTSGEGLKLAQVQAPDLIILDINLPDISGYEFIKALKNSKETRGIPVIMMTGVYRDPEHEYSALVDHLSDDFITKPFRNEIFCARVKALLRRKALRFEESVLKSQKLSVDIPKMRVTVSGKEIKLTKTEFNLLVILLKKKGMPLSKEILTEDLLGYAPDIETGSVYKHVENLRTKLGPQGEKIETVHGVGYKFADEE